MSRAEKANRDSVEIYIECMCVFQNLFVYVVLAEIAGTTFTRGKCERSIESSDNRSVDRAR